MTNTMDPAAQLAANPSSATLPQQLTLEVGPMAHGGHCVARHEGKVVFVRHAIPGEQVVARLTNEGPAGRFWWADTIKVLRASEFRRVHQWKLADSLRAYASGRQPINDAPWGHIILEYQRRLKALSFRDTMARLGQLNAENVDITVQGLDNDEPTGQQWRTRNTFAVTSGRLSMHTTSPAETVPVRNIALAVPRLDKLQLWNLHFTGATRLDVVTPGSTHEALLVITPEAQIAQSPELLEQHVDIWREQIARLPKHVSAIVAMPRDSHGQTEVVVVQGRTWVQEHVTSAQFGTRTFQVSAAGFWHPHRDGAVTLVEAVMRAANVQSDEVIADVFAGTGLFSRYLGEAVGPNGTVLSVETDPIASRDAYQNLHDLPQVTVLNGKPHRVMANWLLTPEAEISEGGLKNQPIDTVVVGTPRASAGRVAIDRLDQLNPSKIVYVASDSTSLARDTRRLLQRGWGLDSIDAYDLAPETHHVDSVSVFTRRA